MKLAALAGIVLVLVPGTTRADVLYPSALVFEPGYAIGPSGGFPVQQVLPNLGDPLSFMGLVATVNAPFADLLPGGIYEITYLLQGATCGIASDQYGPPPCDDHMWAGFSGGALSIYLDTTPDADFTNVATFADGELVLLMENLAVILMDVDDPGPSCSGPYFDLFMGFDFTGGSWFSRVDNVFLWSVFDGEIDGQVPPALQALGFTFRGDGHVDIHQTLATKQVTWGRVKSLYR
jgi:hypothetical protein